MQSYVLKSHKFTNVIPANIRIFIHYLVTNMFDKTRFQISQLLWKFTIRTAQRFQADIKNSKISIFWNQTEEYFVYKIINIKHLEYLKRAF